MAVGADQEALARLGTSLLESAREPILTEAERLQARIEVVKLERDLGAVVTAQPALPARLSHQSLLDAAPPSGDPIRAAALATQPVCGSADRERGLAVSLAAPDHLQPPVGHRLLDLQPPDFLRVRKFKASDPRSNRRGADAEFSRDSGQRLAPQHELLQVS